MAISYAVSGSDCTPTCIVLYACICYKKIIGFGKQDNLKGCLTKLEFLCASHEQKSVHTTGKKVCMLTRHVICGKYSTSVKNVCPYAHDCFNSVDILLKV